MASAAADHTLEEEVGSYWSKDLDLEESSSKPRRATMLERMSSGRPWLRKRITRKNSQTSINSEADSVSQSFSAHTQWNGEGSDNEEPPQEESQADDTSRSWTFTENEFCSPTKNNRTFGDASESTEVGGFFDRAEECPASDTQNEVTSSSGVSSGSSSQAESMTSEERAQSTTGGSSSLSDVSEFSASSPKEPRGVRRWTQGSTASLPLALGSHGRKFAHVANSGALPCHCPACCSCHSSGGSLHTVGSSWSSDMPFVNTFPRVKSRRACPLRSSLEFKAKRSHPGSLVSISTVGSDVERHLPAERQHSAPGSMIRGCKSQTPSIHSAPGMLGRWRGSKTSMVNSNLATQARFTRSDEFGSVQTLCQEKVLVEEEEPRAGGGGMSLREATPLFCDGQMYKNRVETMLGWFDDFSDQQRNMFLHSLLGLCNVPQMHYLSMALEPVLHESCPHNCQDLLSWLPMTISWHILSFLDPVSLCRASQVSRGWYELCDEPMLWRRLCRSAPWAPSDNEYQRMINMYTCPDSGFIDWKDIFSEMYRLRRNWLQGRFTVRTFAGHTSGISCVQFDDTRIISGSSDRTIKVWDIRTNTPWCALTLVGHSATVRCLHLRGNQLVSGSADCTIKVWDLSMDASGCWSSAACRVTMVGHLHTVRCLKVDDTKVVSGSYDMSLKVWDLKSGRCLNTLHGHTGAVICLQYDNERIVSGSADNSIKVWRLGDGECLMTLVGHQDAVTCLQFDSERIISGSVDCAIKFWSLQTGQCIQTLDWIRSEGHRGVVRDLQADKWKIVSGADDKTLKVWSIGKGQRLLTLHCHTDGVTCLQFNDRRIVSGSYDKTVKLYDFSAC